MEFNAKVVKILPEQRFNGRNGELVKYQFVVKTDEQYPKDIYLTCIGDERWSSLNIEDGATYKFSIDISSREWNGRWYTEISCWKSTRLSDGSASRPQPTQVSVAQPQQPQPQSQPQPQPTPQEPASGNDGTDLPF